MKKHVVLLFVLLGHALFLLSLTLLAPATMKEKAKTKIVVHTFASALAPKVIAEAKSAMEEIEEEERAVAIEEAVAEAEPEPEVVENMPEPEPEPEPEPVPEPEPEPLPAPKPKPKPNPKPKPTPKPKPAAKAPAPKKKENVPKPKPQKTKPQKTKLPDSKSPDSKSKVAKKTSPSASAPKKVPNEKLASLMKESLAKLDGIKGSGSAAATPSKKGSAIGVLGSEGLTSGEEAKLKYEEELAIYLKHRLQLPDMGDVKIRLTLSDVGKVLTVSIISSSSEKNRELVEKKVPSITFPPFDERMKGEKKHTFSVTLKTR